MATTKKSTESETAPSKTSPKKATAKTSTASVKDTSKPVKKAAVKKTVAKDDTAKKTSTKKSGAVVPEFSPGERYKMIEIAAYYIAEKNNFSGNAAEYWVLAEREISQKYPK